MSATVKRHRHSKWRLALKWNTVQVPATRINALFITFIINRHADVRQTQRGLTSEITSCVRFIRVDVQSSKNIDSVRRRYLRLLYELVFYVYKFVRVCVLHSFGCRFFRFFLNVGSYVAHSVRSWLYFHLCHIIVDLSLHTTRNHFFIFIHGIHIQSHDRRLHR